jgi:hypothetical protein
MDDIEKAIASVISGTSVDEAVDRLGTIRQLVRAGRAGQKSGLEFGRKGETGPKRLTYSGSRAGAAIVAGFKPFPATMARKADYDVLKKLNSRDPRWKAALSRANAIKVGWRMPLEKD